MLHVGGRRGSRLVHKRLVDGLGAGMAAVAIVLLGVWAVARQGEREVPMPRHSTPIMRRLGLVSILVGAAILGISLVLLIGGEAGRAVWYLVAAGIEIAMGRAARQPDRRESRA